MYYIGMSVLPENQTPLIKFIRKYIWDSSGVFSVSSLVKISMNSVFVSIGTLPCICSLCYANCYKAAEILLPFCCVVCKVSDPIFLEKLPCSRLNIPFYPSPFLNQQQNQDKFFGRGGGEKKG